MEQSQERIISLGKETKMSEVLTVIFCVAVSLFFIREAFTNDDWLCKLIAGTVGLLGLYEITVTIFY